ncbi:DUF1330 domain-containing protein [Actibacterium sp. XHP0104]|uniref:DUF1330 domain-containing protein n=1 Tax=Actibacterium sp. XHP0104 TaxID=2984335 RepID=UPI0021E8A9A9|nr:DUF1330 domain-containing protein [Actibacterium sp. XHP0104]MCV2881239.1 DUF1330 domain-containing protein [Actibacterium sp. XHP0104]
MPAYIIARINVTDADDYMTYASQTVALAEQAGGRFLVKGGAQSIVEGQGPDRHVLIEFPSREQALAWYNSPEYRKILPVALRSSERDLVIVEGI